MASACALAMFSGKNIYNFAILENLRIFQNCLFTGGLCGLSARLRPDRLRHGDAETVLRTAIFQETNVQYIDSLTVTRSGRSIAAAFTGRLKDGTPISLEVKA